MTDLQNTPSYTISDVADYINVPVATLRNWVRGRLYPTVQDGIKRSPPLIRMADPDRNLLSFTNLAEAHVLSAIRRRHGIQMDKVRIALEFLEREMDSAHPLLEREFLTDSKELFIRELHHVINLNREGQYVIEKMLDNYLDRISRDPDGKPLRLYPVGLDPTGARPVMVDPRISFGRLVVTGTGIPVDVLAGRFNAGESLEELAEDYNCEKKAIETAIFWKTTA